MSVTPQDYIFLMRRRVYLRFTLTCSMYALFGTPPTLAQIPQRLDRCLPHPGLPDEISDMREEAHAKLPAASGATELKRTIIIDDVAFDGPTRMPDSVRERLVAEIKQRSYDADSSWLEEIEDASILGAWQDEGFIKALPSARAQTVSTDRTVRHVLLTVHVDEGLQYKLGDVRFRSSDPAVPLVFSNEELQKVIPLREGELFIVRTVREALDALRELYMSRGNIDSLVSAITDIDGEQQRISLTLEIDQGKQYRLGKVEVFGPNPQLEDLLKSALKSGEVYNHQVLRNFLKEQRSSLPPDTSFQDIDYHRNPNSGTVDLRFNFQSCPQMHE